MVLSLEELKEKEYKICFQEQNKYIDIKLIENKKIRSGLEYNFNSAQFDNNNKLFSFPTLTPYH